MRFVMFEKIEILRDDATDGGIADGPPTPALCRAACAVLCRLAGPVSWPDSVWQIRLLHTGWALFAHTRETQEPATSACRI